MGIRCYCPDCNARFEIHAKHAGSRVKCPKCGGAIQVPAAPKESVPPPAVKRKATPPPIAEHGAPPVVAETGAPPVVPPHKTGPADSDPPTEPEPPAAERSVRPNRSTAFALKLTAATLLIGFAALGTYSYLDGKLPTTTASSSEESNETEETDEISNIPLAPAAQKVLDDTYLELNWPENERTGGVVFLCGPKEPKTQVSTAGGQLPGATHTPRFSAPRTELHSQAGRIVRI